MRTPNPGLDLLVEYVGKNHGTVHVVRLPLPLRQLCCGGTKREWCPGAWRGVGWGGVVVFSGEGCFARQFPLRARYNPREGPGGLTGALSVDREGQRETEGETPLPSGVNHEVIEPHFGSILRRRGNSSGERREEVL